MENRQYKIRYLPTFESDLLDAVRYIDEVLQNPNAADRLIDAVEEAIIKRSNCPLSFEPYPSRRERQYPYYRIYVNNYTVYYVVIDGIMEVRRLLYGGRDVNRFL